MTRSNLFLPRAMGKLITRGEVHTGHKSIMSRSNCFLARVNQVPVNDYEINELFLTLPSTREEPIWNDIKSEFGLGVLEFSALKNARCPILSQPPQAGKNDSVIVNIATTAIVDINAWSVSPYYVLDLVAELAKLRLEVQTVFRQGLRGANDTISNVSYSELAKFQLASLEQKRAHTKFSEDVGPPVLSQAEQEALWGEPSCEQTEAVVQASKMEDYSCMKMTRYMQRLFDEEDVQLVNSEETKWIETLSGDRENVLRPNLFLIRKGLQVNSSETGSAPLRMLRHLPENNDVTYSFGKPCHWCLRDCVLAVIEFKVKLTVDDFGHLVSYLQHMSRGDSESTFCGMVCDNSDVWLVACTAGQAVSRIDTTWTTRGSMAFIRQFFSKRNPWCCVLDHCCAVLAVKPIADNSFLGHGAKGKVFTVVALDGRCCALKIVHSKNDDDIAAAQLEVASLKAIKKAGGNVVTIVGELVYYRDSLTTAIHGVGYLMEEVGTPLVADECRASPTLIEEIFHQLHHLHRLRRYHGDAQLQNLIRYDGRLLWIDFMRVNIENPSGVDFVEFVKHDSKTLLQSIFGQVPDGVLPALQSYADSPSDDTIVDLVRAILAVEV